MQKQNPGDACVRTSESECLRMTVTRAHVQRERPSVSMVIKKQILIFSLYSLLTGLVKCLSQKK